MTSTPPPPPPAATDAAAFVAELRRLKTWSDLSFRQLERRATAGGDTLPYSTAATMLSKDRLPRAEVVAAFVKACGVPDAGPWLVARARVADGTAATPASAVAAATPVRQDAPRAPRFRWRRAVVAAAALVAAFAGGTVLDAVTASEVEVEVAAP